MTLIQDAKDLGAFIRRIRKARGYTQAQLAELAGVGVVYIGQLEHGKETAEIGKALKLLQLLSVDLAAIDRQDGSAPASLETSSLGDLQPDMPSQLNDGQSDLPASLKDVYLAFPSFLGDDGQTHTASVDQAFWYRIKRDEQAEPSGDAP